jgi:hypothetical protein
VSKPRLEGIEPANEFFPMDSKVSDVSEPSDVGRVPEIQFVYICTILSIKNK